MVTAIGFAAYQNFGAIWDTLRRRRQLMRPQFAMSSLLAAMGLAGIVAAVAAAMREHFGTLYVVNPLLLGTVAAATALYAAWWTAPDRSWKSRLAALILLIPLAYAFRQIDDSQNLGPFTDFWPNGESNVSREFVETTRADLHLRFVIIQGVLVLAWRHAIRVENGVRPTGRGWWLTAVVLSVLMAVLPIYAIAALQFPAPIPQQLTFAGDDAAFQKLLALSDRFRKTAVWVEICKDNVDDAKVSVAVRQRFAGVPGVARTAGNADPSPAICGME